MRTPAAFPLFVPDNVLGTYLDFQFSLSPALKPGRVYLFVPSPGQDNPGYFPPIFGLFWAIVDYLRLNPGLFPSIYRHIVIHCRCPPLTHNLDLHINF